MLHATHGIELTTPSRNFWPVLDLLRARGLDPERVLAPTGLSERSLRDPEFRVSRLAGDSLRERLVCACPEPGLGVAVARHVGPEIFDVIECAARASATVGDMIEVINRFARLADSDYHFWLESIGNRRFWRFKPLYGASSSAPCPDRLHRYLSEFRIGVLQSGGRRILGTKIPMQEIWFDWPAPPDAAAYAALFDAPVRFDAPFVAIVMLADALAFPVPGHDPTTRTVLEQVAEHRLALLGRPTTLTERTKAIIAEECAHGSPSLTRISRRLGMTPWTLRRRLAAEGHHYHALIQTTRLEMARACLLDPECSITEIAFRLGFRDQSNFFKAFRRWTGQTPAEYRRSAR